MNRQQRTRRLPGGELLKVDIFTRPIEKFDQMRIIELHQHEWDRTDVEWLPSMRGAYSDSLTSLTAMGSLEGVPAGTASTAFPVEEPEICVVEDVMTHPEYRRKGVAAVLVETLLESAFEAGCRLSFLGNAPKNKSVYETVGFTRLAGAMMRRAASGWEDYEIELYRPGQSAVVRETRWGDMPGVAALVAQPSDICLLDYLRGLVSIGHSPVRCVSNFSMLRYGTESAGGSMRSLIGESPYRVLGYGSLTPGAAPVRNCTAVVDVAVHDNWGESAPVLISRLVEDAADRSVTAVEAYIAARDVQKRRWFEETGFMETAVLSEQLRIENQLCDVVLLRRRLGS